MLLIYFWASHSRLQPPHLGDSSATSFISQGKGHATSSENNFVLNFPTSSCHLSQVLFKFLFNYLSFLLFHLLYSKFLITYLYECLASFSFCYECRKAVILLARCVGHLRIVLSGANVPARSKKYFGGNLFLKVVNIPY